MSLQMSHKRGNVSTALQKPCYATQKTSVELMVQLIATVFGVGVISAANVYFIQFFCVMVLVGVNFFGLWVLFMFYSSVFKVANFFFCVITIVFL